MPGLILYEGKSRINNEPVVVIATGLFSKKKSLNTKTGEMIQTWILLSEIDPIEALKIGSDKTICGDCKYRPANSGICYVNVGQAPLNIWRSYKSNKYSKIKSFDVFANSKVRFGSYGDPTAVPIELWQQIAQSCNNKYTGYTHQWLNENNQEYSKYCMASVDTPEEMLVARSMGWRTFRVTSKLEKFAYEFPCPATPDSKIKKTCSECMACNGTKDRNDTRGVPVILVHGAKYKTNRYISLNIEKDKNK